MMEYQRAQLKLAAKRAMKGQRPHPMLITLLFMVLVGIGSRLVSWILGAASGFSKLGTLYLEGIYQYEDPAWAIQRALLSFGPARLVMAVLVGGVLAGLITFLWSGLMGVGYHNFCLGMVRGQQPQTGALFSAFPRFGPVLLTKFLVGVFECLWVLLFAGAEIILILLAAAVLLFSEMEVLMVLIVIVSYIAMFVGIIWATLRYAMVDFLIADQDLTGMDAIRESKRLMRGNIGRLFVLQLSFIGWYLLEYAILLAALITGSIIFGSALAFGTFGGSDTVVAGSLLAFFGIFIAAVIAIGVFNLWLVPYVTGTQALFYDWLRGVNNPAPGGWGGPGGWGQPTQQNYDYSWSSGTTSGTGIGPGPQGGGQNPGGSAPLPPKSPKDDPWE